MSLMVMSSICIRTARPLPDVVLIFTWQFLRQLIMCRYLSDPVFDLQLSKVCCVWE